MNNNKNLIEDGNGNVYLHNDHTPGEVMKISQTGEVLQTLSFGIDTKYYLYAGTGFYVLSEQHTVRFYDLDGAVIWSQSLLEYEDGSMAIDPQGNVLISGLHNTDMSLIKYNKLGEQLFKITAPHLYSKNLSAQVYSNPSFDDKGRIWTLSQAETFVDASKGMKTDKKTKGYYDVMMLDGNTGALLMKKNIFSNVIRWIKDDGKGNKTEEGYDFTALPYGYCDVNNNKMIIAGSLRWTSSKHKANGKSNFVDRSQWRLITVDEKGKSSSFTYKGTGLLTEKDADNVSQTDDGLNAINQLFVGPTGNYYLSGYIGRPDNKAGELHQDMVIMAYNPEKKKPIWKNTMKDIGGWGFIFYKPTEKVLLAISDKTISGFASNGHVLEDTLQFSAPFWGIFSSSQPGDFYVYNGEDSYIAKFHDENLGSASPAQHFRMPNDHEAASTWNLSENYPNPFNPTTTIKVTLSRPSYVTIKVFNMIGQEVITIANREEYSDGENEFEFNANNLPSGVYYYKVNAEDVESGKLMFTTTKKMMLLK